MERNATDFTERMFCSERNGTDFTERSFFVNGTQRILWNGLFLGTERNGTERKGVERNGFLFGTEPNGFLFWTERNETQPPNVDPDPKNGVITKMFAPKFCAEWSCRYIHSSHGDHFRGHFCI